jgi:hypothetical protein
VFGKGWGDLGCAQGVDPPSLGNMGALERLDDPIDTPMKSHVIGSRKTQGKGTQGKGGMRSTPKDGVHVGPRDVMVDGCMGLFGCTQVCEGAHRFVWVHGP